MVIINNVINNVGNDVDNFPLEVDKNKVHNIAL